MFPVLIILMGVMGLGFGMLVSAWTTKYRDLQFLVQFGIQLLMYATPVIYPISAIPQNIIGISYMANPMMSIIETFRYHFSGGDVFMDPGFLLNGLYHCYLPAWTYHI